jgi:hypothetical protein
MELTRYIKQFYKRKTLLFFAALFFGNILFGQSKKALELNINSLINNSHINLSKLESDSLKIETLKFYLTGFSLSKSGKTIWKEKYSYHLVDFSKPKSQYFSLDIGKNVAFDSIHFYLGTDSLTNVSGVMGGDLDPTKGMYWAWNSGYINFKLEGKHKSRPFEFHLGGYTSPFQTVQKINLKVHSVDNLTLSFNISKFLNTIDLVNQPNIMSPCKESKRLSKLAASLFYIDEEK